MNPDQSVIECSPPVTLIPTRARCEGLRVKIRLITTTEFRGRSRFVKEKSLLTLSVAVTLLSVSGLSSAQSQEGKQSRPAPPFRVVRKSADELQASAMRRVDVVYPESAKQDKLSGPVVVEVFVDTLGNVSSARALSGPYALYSAATTAARGWKWEPTRQNGVPVNVSGTLTFKFEPEGGVTDSEDVREAKEAIAADPNSADNYEDLGDALEDSHRYEEAAAAWADFIRLKPEDVRGYRRLASVYDKLGRYKESLTAYERVVAIDPKAVDALHGLGWARIKTGRYDDAITTYMELLSLRPEDARAYHYLGYANYSKGYYGEAIGAYKRATEIKPPYSQLGTVYRELGRAYIKAGRLDDSIEAWKQAIARDPDNEDGYLGLGSTHSQKRQFNEAIEVYKQAILSHPSFARVHYNLGGALSAMGKPTEAIDFMSEALRINPEYARGFSGLAAIQVRLGRFDEAIQNLQQSIRLEPYAPDSFHQLGYAYYKAGRFEEAIDASVEVFNLNAKYEQAAGVYSTIGFAYARLKRLTEAIEACKKGVAAKPDEFRTYITLGEIYELALRWDDAEKAMKQAVAMQPTAVETYRALGHVFEAQQKWDVAEETLRRGVRAGPKDHNSHIALGSFLAKRQRWVEADAEFDEALRISPGSSLALNDKGYYMVERDERLSDALKMIQRAVDAEPGNASFLDSLGWAYFKLGKLDEAERYLTEAIRIGASTTIQEHLGDLYMKRGQAEKANEAWQKAVTMSIETEQTARLKSKLFGNPRK